MGSGGLIWYWPIHGHIHHPIARLIYRILFWSRRTFSGNFFRCDDIDLHPFLDGHGLRATTGYMENPDFAE